MRIITLALAGGIAALATHSHAQSPTTQTTATQALLPDTIVSGTRIPTPQDRVPAAITIITRQEIEERGYQTLAEALTSVPGFRIAQSGGYGGQTSAFVRGNSSRSVLVLLDGVPVNDPSEPNGAFNFGQDLLFDVERIEVLRGPASAMYGSSAIGGVVNLITRRAAPDRTFAPYGEGAGGMQNTWRGGLGATGTVRQVDYLFSGYGLTTRGFNDMAPRFNANIPERDYFRGSQAAARLGWQPTDTTRIEGLFRWRQNNFALDNVPQDDPFYSGVDRRLYGQVRGETVLLDGAWKTGLRLGATEDRRSYTDLASAYNFDTSSNSFYKGSRTFLDWQNTVRLPNLGAFKQGSLAFGVSHGKEEVLSTAGTKYFQTNVDANQTTTAGWGAVQYRAFDRLDLTAGIRQDAVSETSGAFTWRLGGVLALPEIATRVIASVGTGFAAPSLYQRYGVIPGFFRGNPDLKPEYSTAWEIGSETDIKLFGIEGFAMPSWTYFHSRVKDLINFNNAFNSLVNVDRARIQGAELGLTLKPSPKFQATAFWTITEAFDAETNTRLARRPENVVSFLARIAPIPKVVVVPQVSFTGRSPEAAYASYANNGTAYPYARSNLAGAVVNLTATWYAFEKANLFLEARNIFNSKWEPVNGFVTPGPSVMVGTRFAL